MKTLVIEKNKEIAKAILRVSKKTKEFYGNDVVVDAGRDLNIIVKQITISSVADITKVMDKVDIVVAQYIGVTLKRAAQSKGVLLIQTAVKNGKVVLTRLNNPQQRLWRED